MATGLKSKKKSAKVKTTPAHLPAVPQPPGRVLYLYAISQKRDSVLPMLVAESIDGEAAIEAVPCEGYVCWVSRVSREEFADHLTAHMENLEWLASAGLRHQRVVSAIAEKLVALPARFGTVFLGESSMAQHVRERKHALDASFKRVAEADEWGVKIFRIASPAPKASSSPSSGAEYLRRKAEKRQSAIEGKVDDQILSLAARLGSLAVASSPGGKASAGQPGLLWHGSFLVRRKDRKKLEILLKEFATKWQDSRRIDWSGPWPPYSFVGHDAD